MRVLVVGSGLSGVAASMPLVARGHEVTIVDGGQRIEPEFARLAATVSATPKADWTNETLTRLRHNPTVGEPVPRRRVFGSQWYMRAGLDAVAAPGQPPVLATSLARGGLAEAWGAAVLPVAAADSADWCVSADDLAPHYRAVLAALPLQAVEDGLAAHFPLHASPGASLPLNRGDDTLIERADACRDELATAGLYIGRARLALRAPDTEGDGGCNRCGICLLGCPRGAIYSPRQQLQRWIESGAVTYLPGRLVDSVAESDGGVEVLWRVLPDEITERHDFDRVLIGAGPVQTGRIVLNSCAPSPRPLELRTSQKFLVPFVAPSAPGALYGEPRITLPGIFADLLDRTVSPHWVHLQLSGCNSLVEEHCGLPVGSKSSFRRTLLGPIVSRIYAGWGGVHSSHSPSVALSVQSGRIHTRVIEGGSSRSVARLASRRLIELLSRIGLRSTTSATRVGGVGGGAHFGASLPMRERPDLPHDSDLVGRPFGWRRIHVVDASVLPSIPATTIGLPTMANAHRIGTAVADMGG